MGTTSARTTMELESEMPLQAHMLLPLDGSRFAEALIPSVIPLALMSHSTVTLLTVIDPLAVVFEPFGMVMPFPDYQQEAWEREAHDYLAKVARPLLAQGVPVRIKILRGNPALSIATYVKQVAGKHLFVMTAHHHCMAYRLIKHSISAQLARLVAPPILVLFPHGEMVESPPSVCYRKLLVLVDEEISAEPALRVASHLAARIGAALVQVFIAPASVSPGSPTTRHLASQWQGAHRLASPHAQIDVLPAPGEVVQTEMICAQTAEEIFGIVAQQQPDLLVMAAQQRSVVRRLFSGSAASKVIRGAGIPTLLV